MRVLSTAELLQVWEQGISQSANQRALMLLAAACPEIPLEQLTELSIGQRDSLLLTLREWMMGPNLASLASCPGCGYRLELNFAIADIRVDSQSEPGAVLSLQIVDYDVQFRLPNSVDLTAIVGQNDLAAARDRLLQRCIISIQHQGEVQTLDKLTDPVIQGILHEMAEADPQADIQISLSCPACGHQWNVTFDIVSFFWSEIHAWACRILREVHALASAYGWREADILAMSSQRRQIYLEMIGE
jgi:hypothetical protein